MSKFLKSMIAGTALLALAPLAALPADAPQKSYVVLDKSLSQLRADFNANVGKVRMLYIVGPTCGICLRGMSENVVPASHLITNRHTTQYWEETGITGKLMQQVMGVNKYVWDFWTIYGPKAVWSDERQPPAPDFWQHQLDGLPVEKKLDANVFAAKIDEFLSQIPTAPVASTTGVATPKSE